MIRVIVDSGSSIKQHEKDIYNVDIKQKVLSRQK